MKHNKAKSFFYITAAICLLVFSLVYVYNELYIANRYIRITQNEDDVVRVRIFDTYTKQMRIYHTAFDGSAWQYWYYTKEPEYIN